MNSVGEAVQGDIKSLNQAARLGRELAELVDEWSVIPNDPRAQEVASEMIHKAREVLRASKPLARAARTA